MVMTMNKGLWEVTVQRVKSEWDGNNPESVVETGRDYRDYEVWASTREEAAEQAILWGLKDQEVTAVRVMRAVRAER